MGRNLVYARVSSESQQHDGQLEALRARVPADAQFFTETASGSKRRPVLEMIVAEAKASDTVWVYAVDRLGRKTLDVLQTIQTLRDKGVRIVSLREGVDMSTPVGALVCELLISVAALERNLIAERTRAGLAAARLKGRLGGRRSETPMESVRAAIRLVVDDGWSVRQAAQSCGVYESRVRYHLRKRAAGAPSSGPATGAA